jgi:CheY-like chemotaxis protein
MKILVVDDEAKTAKFLKKGLAEAGFVVDVATNGGLQLAQDVDFDLVILDVMLPRLDGRHLLTRLRQGRPGNPGPSAHRPGCDPRAGTRIRPRGGRLPGEAIRIF